MYFNGKGVGQSDEKAFKWYLKSAEQRHAGAQYKLGWMYEYGLGVDQSYELAVEGYKKAAEQGHIGSLDVLNEIADKADRFA